LLYAVSVLAYFQPLTVDLYSQFLCVGYVTFVKTQTHRHEQLKALMLDLDARMHQTTDMLTNEQYISMLDLLSSVQFSLDAGRQALTGLSALLTRTCTLEQLAKFMVYSFPYWFQTAPRKCKGLMALGVGQGQQEGC
jgi:hypothetical protein